MKVFLGIDTSNYTTSAALCDTDGNIIRQLKIPLSVADGQRGLRQSDAVFQHTVNLPAVMEQLFDSTERYEITAIGYSQKPCDAEDSYMPCFLSGTASARALAAVLAIPAFPFSHQSGHIMAAMYSAKMTYDSGPFLAFHISGGTTDLLYNEFQDNRLKSEKIGASLDLHAGQVVDRVGVMLGLSFPAGPDLEKLAQNCTVPVPVPKICVKNSFCNLSGLENLAKKLYDTGEAPETVAAFVFSFLQKTFAAMLQTAFEKYHDLPVLFAGGVSGNRLIRPFLSKICRAGAFFAEPSFSSDNAAGIALLTKFNYGAVT